MSFLADYAINNVAANSNGLSRSNSATFTSSMQLVLAALQNIPADDKCDLVEALVKAPHLVERESDPIRFLQFENLNHAAAAVRMCTYWKHRRNFFKERAFLPMNITGDGAMSNDDVFHLSKGFLRILPNDKDGRPVVFTEKEKLVSLPLDNRKRITFYIYHLIAFENEASVTKGFISIVLLTSFKFDINTAPVSTEVLKGLPTRAHLTQVFCYNVNSSAYAVIANFAAIVVRLFGIQSLQSTKLDMIESPQERLSKLLPLGLRGSGLPIEVGGSLGPEAVFEWIRNRITTDAKRVSLSQSNKRKSEPNLRLLELEQPPTNETARTLLAGPTKPANMTNLGSLNRLSSFERSLSMQVEPQSMVGQSAGSTNPDETLALLLRLQSSGSRGGLAYSQTINPYQANRTLFAPSLPLLPTNAAATLVASLPRAAATLPRGALMNDSKNNSASARKNSESSADSAEPVKTAMIMFEEAIKIIPHDKKLAYLEAMEKAPFLFEKECNPLKFLRAEEFDSWKAAERMVGYWILRKELFGDRAFLPMTQTGRGALTPDDVICLGGGYAAVGPKTKDGKSILIFDRTRQLNSPEGDNTVGMRCAFYIMTILAENEFDQQNGIAVFSMMVAPRAVEYGEKNFERAIRVGTLVPIKVASLNIISCPPKSLHRSVVERVLAVVMGMLKHYFTGRVKLYSAECPDEIFSQLKKKGYTKIMLPATIGGVWKYDEFTHWLRQRKQYEEDMMTHLSAPWIYEPIANPATNNLNTEERKAHKRRLNVVHSRQKRERRKAEVEELKQKCSDVKAEHKKLKIENERLEKLLAESKEKIAQLDCKQPSR